MCTCGSFWCVYSPVANFCMLLAFLQIWRPGIVQARIILLSFSIISRGPPVVLLCVERPDLFCFPPELGDCEDERELVDCRIWLFASTLFAVPACRDCTGRIRAPSCLLSIVSILLQERGQQCMPLCRSLWLWWACCEHGLQNLAKGGAITRFCCIDLRESSISILLSKSAFQGSAALSNQEFRG